MANEEVTAEGGEEKTPGRVPVIIDAGEVFLMVGDPSGKIVPMALPDVFQQMFAILGDLDNRLAAVETPSKEESRIITV